MRKFLPLRPRVYADEVQKLIERLGDTDIQIDPHVEATAISEQSGVSVEAALKDLMEAGVISRFSARKARGGGVCG